MRPQCARADHDASHARIRIREDEAVNEQRGNQGGQGGEMEQQPPEDQQQADMEGVTQTPEANLSSQMQNEGQEGAEQQGGQGQSQSQ